MQGIEHVQLRLSNAGSNFTIDDTENCTTATPTHANRFAQTCLENAGPLPAPTVDVYGGTSNDTFNVRGIGAATTIMGGGGTDTINVQSTASDLSGILSRLTIDGNDMLTTQTTNVTTTNSDPATNALVQQFLGPVDPRGRDEPGDGERPDGLPGELGADPLPVQHLGAVQRRATRPGRSRCAPS